MRLLLDSHILLWWPSGDPRLGKRATNLLVTGGNELFFSAASWWELGIKEAAGRLRFDLVEFRAALRQRGVAEMSVTFEHTEAARNLPTLHTDPFDHMLVAQAISESCRLLTRDKKLAPYGAAVLVV